MDVEMSDNSEINNIQVRLITKQEQYAIPSTPLYIPASTNVTDFNVLINGLCKEFNSEHDIVEFDILISSEFLRSSLIEHINNKGISIEDVIEVEYIEQHPPPEPAECLLHDDWVYALDVCEKWILTGCYDNTIHIWTTKGKHLLTIPAHKEEIKAVGWISVGEETATFVSASMDNTAIIWKWNIPSNSVKSVYLCLGHENIIETLSVNHEKSLMVTGGCDKFLKIWSTSLRDENEEGVSAPKQVKKNAIRAPERTMLGHKEMISGVVWSDKTEIVTCSWDHTIKTWDVELGGIKQEIPGNRVITDVDYSPLNKCLLSSSIDGYLRLYDPRSTEGTIVKATYKSHKIWSQSVKWSKINEHLFLSCAYDNMVKLWDTRTTKTSLYDLSGHSDRVFCCNWSNPKLMVSGSADKTVRIFKAKYSPAS